MLPVHEFCEASGRCYRRARWALYPLLIVATTVPVFLLFPLISKRLNADLRPHVRESVFSVVLILSALLCLLPSAPPALLVAWLFGRQARRNPRLVCPHCDLALAHYSSRVVATRSCPQCDQVILIDPFPAEPVPLTPAAAVEQAARWRRFRRRGLRVIALMALVPLPLLVLDGEGVLPNSNAVAAVLASGVVIWTVWMGVRNSRQRRALMLTCPRCGELQEPDFVARFGHCGACSQPLIDDSPSEPTAVGEPC